ncbi:hypothetical protein AH04_193 [Erwinia phage AH04]|uniref:Uncharacterized protein n=1 Tax=Erwinia phage AH04 TaxID=2869569 RepID=A0AAE7X112_9CAUD|nr:hypothetical protein PQC02_gp121 [Erwinia phage AH04]QZA70668.1 hypothetical protein AH04_193 [Erwinia phage AH04]
MNFSIAENHKHDLYIGDLVIEFTSFDLCALCIYLAYVANTESEKCHQFLLNKDTDKNTFSIYYGHDDIFIINSDDNPSQEVTRDELRILGGIIAEYTQYDQYTERMLGTGEWEIPEAELYYHLTSTDVVAIVYQNHPEISNVYVGLYLSDTGCCWGVIGPHQSNDEFDRNFVFTKEILAGQI